MDIHTITLRWVGPNGQVVASPTEVSWQFHSFSPFEISKRGFSWVEMDRHDKNGEGQLELVRRPGLARYLGEGEFGPVQVGPREPVAISDSE